MSSFPHSPASTKYEDPRTAFESLKRFVHFIKCLSAYNWITCTCTNNGGLITFTCTCTNDGGLNTCTCTNDGGLITFTCTCTNDGGLNTCTCTNNGELITCTCTNHGGLFTCTCTNDGGLITLCYYEEENKILYIRLLVIPN